MPRTPAQLLRSGLVWLLLQPFMPAMAKPAPANTESSEGEMVFSLLPRSMQKNPLVDQTVITEMTEEGKKLPEPTPANPVYYTAQSGGFHTTGHDPAPTQPPSPEDIEASMKHALAINGYTPASPVHTPALLVVYYWGLYSNLDPGSSEIDDTGFTDAGHAILLGRAALVGGAKFAAGLKTALERQDSQDQAMATMDPALTEKLPDYGPLRQFTERDRKTKQLYEESLAPCYYVVVSAYDYASATKGQRKLLWRSKMTVESTGVGMTDSVPALIANAGRYFGRDMPESATMTKPILREGHTKLGPLEVEEYIDKNAPAAAAPKP